MTAERIPGEIQKCYNIMVTGKVQDIGFRAVIEYAGRLFDLSGLVFNARDGSVRIVCCGEESIIGEFSQEIRTRGVQRGAAIQEIKKEELPIEIDLPYPFSKVFTEGDVDLGRKLDIGNELLTDIKGDTRILPEIKSDTSALPEIKDMLGSFVVEQREHNRHLEKILEKLAER